MKHRVDDFITEVDHYFAAKLAAAIRRTLDVGNQQPMSRRSCGSECGCPPLPVDNPMRAMVDVDLACIPSYITIDEDRGTQASTAALVITDMTRLDIHKRETAMMMQWHQLYTPSERQRHNLEQALLRMSSETFSR